MPEAIIHIVLFFVKCGVLHAFLRLILRKRFDKSFIRTLIAMGVAFALYLLLNSRIPPFPAEGSFPISRLVSGTLLFICTFPFVRYALRPGRLLTPLACMVFVAASLGLDHLASAYVQPVQMDTATVEKLQELLPEREDEPDKPKDTNAVNVVDAALEGVEAYKQLTEEKEMKAMGKDFRRGLKLFAERKAWMDNLTPEEKAAYRAEMQQFLAEQGLAEDPSSLACIRSSNPTNLSTLASLFDGIESQTGGDAYERSRKITETISGLTDKLSGVELTPENKAVLQRVSEKMAANDSKGAMEDARKLLKDSEGKNQFAGTLVAALMKATSGLPSGLVVGGKKEEKEKRPSLREKLFAKKAAEKPSAQPEEKKPDPVATSLVDVTVEEADIAVSTDTYIPISAELGVVHVPSDPAEMADWISAVHSLSVSGFASLGGEIVILLDNGTVYRNGDVWQIEYNGFQYRFSIDKVFKNKVHLTGMDRTALAKMASIDT